MRKVVKNVFEAEVCTVWVSKGVAQKDLCFASCTKPNVFYLVFKEKILAKIYKVGVKWYVFYLGTNCRVPVASFSEAMKLLEKDFSRCRTNTTTKKK